MAKLFLMDDDESLVSVLRKAFEQAGYLIETCYLTAPAKEMLALSKFDVIILDVDLPDGSGFDVCKSYRNSGGRTPILMLTGKSEIHDKELGLDLGADDYLTKPFSVKELMARIRALQRRPATFVEREICFGSAVMDVINRRLLVNGKPVHMQPLDFSLLEYFARHPDQILSQEVLLKAVWDTYTESGVEALRASVKRIRKEIDQAGEESRIETLYKVGYIFHLKDRN